MWRQRVSIVRVAGVSLARTSTFKQLLNGASLGRRFQHNTINRKTPKGGLSLDITTLRREYYQKNLTPTALVEEIAARIQDQGDDKVWITKTPVKELRARAQDLQGLLEKAQKNGSEAEFYQHYPLFGIPFGVKDNIDVAGYPTTAACPDFSYTAAKHNPVIQKILDAGGIFVGKQNLDQFATGLVGIRSPYGTPRNPFDSRFVPGGSSSGSAVAVSSGLVSFSIGTDTAGSGRVPASFNNVIGMKPTRGMLSCTGLVPACRSLDCLAIFALTCEDAWSVYQTSKGYDESDEYSRKEPDQHYSVSGGGGYYHNEGNRLASRVGSKTIRFGIPAAKDLKFFGDSAAAATKLYHEAVDTLSSLNGGVRPVEIDFEPWTQVAKILYDGPWISERLSGLRDFWKTHPNSFYPTTQAILKRGEGFTAMDTFLGMRHLERLRRVTDKTWDSIDILIVPTASATPTISEVEAEPTALNTKLGYYTNFMNLLDLCGLALPNAFLPNGMPSGITLVAPAYNDQWLNTIGREFEHHRRLNLGATNHTIPPPLYIGHSKAGEVVHLAVFGAHLSGEPLNYQLRDVGAKLVKTTTTAPRYKFFDLDGKKPGLIHVDAVNGKEDSGKKIDCEVWAVPADLFGTFMENVRSPLAIGSVHLADGSTVKGFLAEEYATKTGAAKDISTIGGWRKYKHGK